MAPLNRQAVFSMVAVLVFALGMGALWVMQRGFGEQFGVGFSVGGVCGIALTILAVGWRRGRPD